MAIESINPATGERLQTHEEMPRAAVEAIIGKTHAAFVGWRRTSFDERSQRTRAAAQVPGVTEVRPGTYIFGDYMTAEQNYISYDDIALSILCTVVSRPAS